MMLYCIYPLCFLCLSSLPRNGREKLLILISSTELGCTIDAITVAGVGNFSKTA